MSGLWLWRDSMFWRLVPTLFIVACLVATGLIAISTVNEDSRLRVVLNPVELRRAAQHLMSDSTPLPDLEGPLAVRCNDALHVWSERLLSRAMADRSGDINPNSFHGASRAGRLAVVLRTASGDSCTFPAEGTGPTPALREQLDAAVRRSPGAAQAIVDLPDSWISSTTVTQGNGSAHLTVGVQILSPMAKLMQPKPLIRPLAVFILVINIPTALFLVFLVVRRIRRADEVARAWTSGELGARINDPGRDEFARLSQKFDLMADAMAGVIQVKQSLAAAEERNRLARDLHDSSKQRAFALNLQLSVMQKRVGSDGELGTLVAAALALTGQLQQDLDSVIQRLAAPTIVESGLRHVLAQAVDTLLAGSGMTWSLSLKNDDEQHLSASPEVARQLLLITVEAVANALKHANCSHCWIGAERTDDVFAWTVSDNGTATFPASMVSKGMGLANMRLRADSLPEGMFSILPRDGGGTTVLVNFLITALEQS